MYRLIRYLTLVSAFSAVVSLAADPPASQRGGTDRPVTSQEIQILQQEIADTSSSSVEGILDYHTETGDLNNRLDFWRYGAQLNYRYKPGSILYARATGTSYLTQGNYLDAQGVNLTGGIKRSFSEGIAAQAEAGFTHFSTGGTTANALGTLRYKAPGGSSLFVTGSRTNVEESLLSSAGIRPAFGTFAGHLVGEVMDNRVVGGFGLQITPKFDVSGQGGGGARTGENIETNYFRTAQGGAGYNLMTGPDAASVSLVRATYALDYFGFDKNLLGFGGASLLDRAGRPIPVNLVGLDGISPFGSPGLGGYFSPDYFLSNVGRLEVRGRPRPHLEYDVSGFLGAQNYTGSDTRLASGFYGSVTFRLTNRFSIPVTYMLDNFGPFTQQTLFFRLVARI